MTGFPADPAPPVEVEWQFDAPDLEAVARWLASQPAHNPLTFVPQAERLQRDRYLDTDDWRVYRARYTLRVRRLADSAEVTMKAFGVEQGGLRSRIEINQQLPAVDADPLGEAGPVRDRLRRLLGSRGLRPLFEIETHRRPYLIQQHGGTLATLTLDEAVVDQAATLAPIRRVEVEEAYPGAMSALGQFIEALRTATGLQIATQSKFEAGLSAAALSPTDGFDFGSVTPAADAPAGEFAFTVLRRHFAELLAHEPGTRLGEDIEELHQMRVATRRLRAAMSAFEPVLPPELHGLRDELRWLAAALGAVRDLDVQAEALETIRRDAGWDEGIALVPLLDVVRESRESARELLLATLDSAAYDSLIARMTESLRAGPVAGEQPVEQAPRFARSLLRQRYRRFRRDADRLTPRSEPAEYHAVRIRAKRLRYSVEFTSPLFGRPAARVTRALRAMQDLLGEHQDADVARAWLRETARERGHELPADTLYLMGQLSERHRERMEELRREWPKAFARLRDQWAGLRRTMDADPGPTAPPVARARSRAAGSPPPLPRRTRYRLLRLPRFPRKPDPGPDQ